MHVFGLSSLGQGRQKYLKLSFPCVTYKGATIQMLIQKQLSMSSRNSYLLGLSSIARGPQVSYKLTFPWICHHAPDKDTNQILIQKLPTPFFPTHVLRSSSLQLEGPTGEKCKLIPLKWRQDNIYKTKQWTRTGKFNLCPLFPHPQAMAFRKIRLITHFSPPRRKENNPLYSVSPRHDSSSTFIWVI